MKVTHSKNKQLKVLILGASGMLGSATYGLLFRNRNLKVFGTIRSDASKSFFSGGLAENLISNIDIENIDSLISAIASTKPDVVINCIGIIKQLSDSNDPLKSLPINSLLPHRLQLLCQSIGARLILISTDCVFSGKKGNYSETDFPDCEDLYGKSKLLGEIYNSKNVLTIRTSIIGHELRGGHSLVDWFLNTSGEVAGYSNAVFSGLPTIELAQIIENIIYKYPNLHGLYHISSDPINKYELLKLIASVYNKKTQVIKSDQIKIDRSLNHEKFQNETGYKPKKWIELVKLMKTSVI